MNVGSLWFLVLCGMVAIVFYAVPRRGFRRAFLSLVNLAFLVPLVPNWQSWVWFALFIGGTFGMLQLVKARPSGRLVFAAIAGVIALFIVLKKYAFLALLLPADFWQHPVELVGLSYMLFKFIHMLVDQWQGQLAPCDFSGYANYQLAFFTLLAGPIQRYNDFQRSWSEMQNTPESSRETLLSWSRILTGMIKMGAVAPLAYYAFKRTQLDLDPLPTSELLLRFLIYFYSYPMFLYFNFSGYTDIVIGCARLLGFDLPENFNYPFVARNVIDFWNRWHISLTHWIRDYVFMTSYKAAAERCPAASKTIGYGILFCALLLVGTWHGSSGRFVVFGTMHGLGAAATQAYSDALKAWLGRAGYQRYLKIGWIHLLAVVVTFHFVCFSLLFFPCEIQHTLEILRAVGGRLELSNSLRRLRALRVVVLAILPLLLAAWWKWDALRGFLERFRKRMTETANSLYLTVLVQAVVAVLLVMSMWAIEQQDPVIVYMRF